MNQFEKHYTREEARALLPRIREWLDRLLEIRGDLEKYDARLSSLMGPGLDVGGDLVDDWVRRMAEIKGIISEFHEREIQIKDLDRGLIDFPAIIAGKEAFLCWERGEDDIEFWHDLDTGYAGREPL